MDDIDENGGGLGEVSQMVEGLLGKGSIPYLHFKCIVLYRQLLLATFNFLKETGLLSTLECSNQANCKPPFNYQPMGHCIYKIEPKN